MKLRKVLAGAMALVMVAGSLLVAPVTTKADAQSMDNLDCTGWWTAHTAGIEINDGGTYVVDFKAQYQADWDSTLPQDNWDAPVYVFYSGNEAKVNGDGYSEHYVCRADIYGWAGVSGATGSQEGGLNCDWTNGWTPYLAGLVAGTDCKLVVTRDGSTVTAVSTIANVETVCTITLPETVANEDVIYVSLTGQCCKLTDISWEAPSSIEIMNPIEALTLGKTADFQTVINTFKGTTDNVAEKVTWTSSDETVATVDETGKVTPVAAGNVTITATCGDISDSCTFEVLEDLNPITAVDVTTDKTEIKVGQTALLSTELTLTNPDKASTDNTTVTYTSSDETVATVDATGKVTALKPGKVTITASVLDGAMKDTVEITVPAVPVTEIKLAVDKTELEKGDIVNIVPTVNPADTTEDTTITWTSSNEEVATVDANGTVTAVGGGNATITAAIGDVKAKVTFKVTAQETVVKKSTIADFTVDAFLSVQSDGVELKKGHTYTFTFNAKGTDAASTNLYEAPCYFIYTNSENKFNTADYKELIFTRGDVWGWFNADVTQTPEALPDGATFTRTFPEDWDAWTAAMKAGADCKIVVKYDGTTVTATYTIGDASTVASFPATVPSGSKLYLGLTGEKVALTDIEVSDEYVTTISGKGDMLPVVPVVLVLLGGAVVIVAAKKRFA